jgi:glycine/D-amino acid oxidase-like deaminating enzyme
MTHHEAARLDMDASGVRAITADAVIEARRALVCLNAFSPLLLPALRGVILPKRGQMLAFRTASPIFERSYYANHGSEYFRQATREAAILGGWRTHFADVETGYEERTTDEVQGGLERFAAMLLGGPIEVIERWSGTMGFTPDGLPLIGPIGNAGCSAPLDSPLWLCGGYTGHGMSMAFKAGSEAARAMLEGREPPFAVRRLAGG